MRITTDKPAVSPAFVEERLEWLEKRVDPSHVEEVERRHEEVFRFSAVDRLPVLITMRDDVAHSTRDHGQWPSYTFDRMWDDYGAMLLNELQPVYESMIFHDDKVFTVRPNLSQIVIPSFFGAEGELISGSEDSMPSVSRRPTREELLSLAAHPPDIREHWAIKKYRGIIDCWRGLLRGHPALERAVHYSLPDLQGPFNVYCHLRGTEAYTDLYEEPGLVHAVMAVITQTLVEATRHLCRYIGEEGFGYHWNYKYPGTIRNVDDSAILISRAQYEEFVDPCNKKLARECGGGIHHYCGVGDHVLDLIMGTEGIHGLNFGNPEMQDWERVYKRGMEEGVALLWDRQIPPKTFSGYSAGIIMKIVVPDVETGRETAAAYGLRAHKGF